MVQDEVFLVWYITRETCVVVLFEDCCSVGIHSEWRKGVSML